MKKTPKFLIEISLVLTAISIKARNAGNNVKDYFYEEETIKHITLVLYDLLPLSVKIGMRYQKFHEIFEKNFIGIRNGLLGKADTINQEPIIETNQKKDVVEKVKATKKINKEKEVKVKSLKKEIKEPVTKSKIKPLMEKSIKPVKEKLIKKDQPNEK